MSKPRGYWTRERVMAEAAKYQTVSQWLKSSSGSYQAAWREGWLGEACKYMTSVKKPDGYWTFKAVKVEAAKYPTKMKWKQSSGGSYLAAWKKGWLAEVTRHMETRVSK